MERFWSKTVKNEKNGCINWIASKNKCGYGQFRIGNKILYANRVSYELSIGGIPKNMEVCHKCDNPACVNPDHLFLGTHKDNMNDASVKKRFPNRKGQNNPSAKLTENDIRDIKILLQTDLSQRKIGLLFSVGQTTISDIKMGKNWS